MKGMLHLLLAGLLAAPAAGAPPHWSRAQAERLMEWMDVAQDDALNVPPADAAAVRSALEEGDQDRLDTAATEAAGRLLTAHRQGCCNAALRTGWHIESDQALPEREAVAAAVAADRLDALFRSARPSHPFYEALRKAYADERDPARRATLAANLDRWRWMPRDMGPRYLLVNVAAFEATLWQGREMIGRWAVIVGKTKSPTPVFRAQVTGVTFNPWWEIPPSIAAEGIASMIAKRPADAARQGYVLQGGRYRQQPGPANALGRMKLVMPNAYDVYLHDTPAQGLFAQDVRAFSHGCVRVGDAIGLATALLSIQRDWERARSDALVASGRTVTVALATPVPIYIAYFTAEPDGLGGVRYFPDVYRRDRGASAPSQDGQCAR